MKYLQCTTIAILLTIPQVTLAWDGYDYDKGNYVEIDKGNLVRPGNDIEVYDYDTGQYHDVTVDSIHKYGSDVEIEVFDNTTGDYRTLNMDDN